jgi:hypothetical protein
MDYVLYASYVILIYTDTTTSMLYTSNAVLKYFAIVKIITRDP